MGQSEVNYGSTFGIWLSRLPNLKLCVHFRLYTICSYILPVWFGIIKDTWQVFSDIYPKWLFAGRQGHNKSISVTLSQTCQHRFDRSIFFIVGCMPVIFFVCGILDLTQFDTLKTIDCLEPVCCRYGYTHVKFPLLGIGWPNWKKKGLQLYSIAIIYICMSGFQFCVSHLISLSNKNACFSYLQDPCGHLTLTSLLSGCCLGSTVTLFITTASLLSALFCFIHDLELMIHILPSYLLCLK